MKLRTTPRLWQQTALLYRCRTEKDSLGNETAAYDMERSDGTLSGSFQFPRGWNPTGQVGSAGNRVEPEGQVSGGVLEAFFSADIAVAPFDRIKLGEEVWEVRAVHPWPHHTRVLLQPVK